MLYNMNTLYSTALFKMVMMINFMLYIFYHNKIIVKLKQCKIFLLSYFDEVLFTLTTEYLVSAPRYALSVKYNQIPNT